MSARRVYFWMRLVPWTWFVIEYRVRDFLGCWVQWVVSEWWILPSELSANLFAASRFAISSARSSTLFQTSHSNPCLLASSPLFPPPIFLSLPSIYSLFPFLSSFILGKFSALDTREKLVGMYDPMGCIRVVDPSLADWAACVKVFTDLYSLSNSSQIQKTMPPK